MSLFSRILNVFRSDRLDAEIEEEFESHLEEAIASGREKKLCCVCGRSGPRWALALPPLSRCTTRYAARRLAPPLVRNRWNLRRPLKVTCIVLE